MFSYSFLSSKCTEKVLRKQGGKEGGKREKGKGKSAGEVGSLDKKCRKINNQSLGFYFALNIYY
jgi:hypothetical protein